jgi:hypothetical protein
MASRWKQIWDEIRNPFKRSFHDVKDNAVSIIIEGFGRYWVAREVREKLREYKQRAEGLYLEVKRLGKYIFQLQSMLARAESYMRDQELTDDQIAEILHGDTLPEEELGDPESF